MNGSLIELLGVGRHELVAFVGGGGKSTLTLGLGRELADRLQPVVMTTTTKMGTEQIPGWATLCHNAADVRAAIDAGRPAYLLGAIDGSKVIGVDPAMVDRVFGLGDVTVLVEADGARRRPFKAPGPAEPVVPSSATLVVVVVGLDAIGHPIGEVCHRPERVAILTGKTMTDTVQPNDVAVVVDHADGGRRGVPGGARIILALTKVERRHGPAVDQIRAGVPASIDLVTIAAL